MAKDQKKKVTINPVTRIEGHAKITLHLDDNGEVADARFHVNEFRGFEKFCEGRMFTEMPTITARICGICPVSHSVSSAKACEDIMRLSIPRTADLLRKIIHLGQNISSHALSFFHLSSPDFLLGWDHDPATRNILGIAQKNPELARRGIRLRKFGQEICERITGKKIHAIGITPGGMISGLKEEDRVALVNWLPEVYETAKMAIEIFKKYRDNNGEELKKFAQPSTLYLGTVGPDGEMELYDGKLRWVDAEGKVLVDQYDPRKYLDYIAESPIPWSYLKYPYFKPKGQPDGYYRVGPLARLNVASKMKTDQANVEFKEFKQLNAGKPVHGSMYFHYARLIEVLGSIEEIEGILNDPEITSTQIYAEGRRNQSEGVGSTEAPRGTLFHHYKVDDSGQLTSVNLLIATGQNNPSMNGDILHVARNFVNGKKIEEGALNRVEGAIRAYDPCLSCSTHAIGAMPLKIELVDADGEILQEVSRS